MKKTLSAFLLFASTLIGMQTFAGTKPSYKIVNRIHLEGNGGWDYLQADEASGLLYVSHGTIVQVVNMKTGKLIATIEDTRGVHGITIAATLSKGYISCGKDSTVLVFDTKTFKPLSRIRVNGANPDAILFDPFSKKVFVFNGRTKNATIIDAIWDKVVADIALEGKPEFAATDEKGKIYVNIEDKSTLCVINTSTLKVEQCWPVAPTEEPSGLALDNVNHRLFSVGDKKMTILDGLSGKVVATIPIGMGVDGVSYDPSLKRIYSANGEGNITIVQQDGADSYKVLESFPTQKGARTITVDTKTHHIYLPVAEYDEEPDAPKGKGHSRPPVRSGSFVILDIAPE